jgi:hypothetical protein
MEYEQTDSRSNIDPSRSPEERRQIETAADDITQFLIQQNIDPNNVLLRGGKGSNIPEYNQDGEPYVFFGSVKDLYPAPDSENEEERQDAWMGNPLRYALMASDGVIALYDKDSIASTPDVEMADDGDGDMVIANTQYADQMRFMGAIHVIRNPRVLKLSQEDYDKINWNIDPADHSEIFGVPVDSGIMKIEIVGQNNEIRTEYRETGRRQFGDDVRIVVEVGRETDQTEVQSEVGKTGLTLADIGSPDDTPPIETEKETDVPEKREDESNVEDEQPDINNEAMNELKRKVEKTVDELRFVTLKSAKKMEEIIDKAFRLTINPSVGEEIGYETKSIVNQLNEMYDVMNRVVRTLSMESSEGNFSPTEVRDIQTIAEKMAYARGLVNALLDDNLLKRLQQLRDIDDDMLRIQTESMAKRGDFEFIIVTLRRVKIALDDV